MADNKLIVFAVVGVLIGAAIGVGIGFAVFHNDKEEQTYWFYIDYGAKADADHVNGWVSVKATSTADAVKKIPGVKTSESETYGTSLDGINGVESGGSGEPYWGQWIRNGDYAGATDFEKNFSSSNFGLGKTYCTVMYLGYYTWGTIPTDAGWKTTGPFAS